MYTILLVDDDITFRAKFKSMLDWEKEGYAICAEAGNGKAAIEIMGEVKPDMVITDISMPVVNGIELIDYVTEMYSDTPIIALSAYNDFDFVRASLKKGASDYLLKNQLGQRNLLEVLNGMVKEMPVKKTGYVRKSLGREASIQEFVFVLLSGGISSRESLYDWLGEMKLQRLEKNVAVVVAELDNNEEYLKRLNADEYHKFIYSVKSIMQESVDSDLDFLITIIGRTQIMMLIPVREHGTKILDCFYKNILVNMRENVVRFLGEVLSFGVSSVCPDILEVSEYYKEAWKNLHDKKFQGRKCFIAEKTLEDKNTGIITLGIKNEQDIIAALTGKSEYTPDIVVGHIFDLFMETECTSEDLQMVLAELLNIISKEIRDRNIPEELILDEKKLAVITLRKYKDICEVKEWFQESFMMLYNCAGLIRQRMQYSENVRRAIQYMENNYNSRISLRNVAKALNINSSYLSRLFKAETGINVINYLNNIRINKSAKLIEEGKTSLKEIADEVGIQNYNHFFKLFKNIYFITPTEYRDHINKNIK